MTAPLDLVALRALAERLRGFVESGLIVFEAPEASDAVAQAIDELEAARGEREQYQSIRVRFAQDMARLIGGLEDVREQAQRYREALAVARPQLTAAYAIHKSECPNGATCSHTIEMGKALDAISAALAAPARTNEQENPDGTT